ncbi:MAG: cell division protein SepF [Clostridia bacterium]|nr:cell division protein SepF [Clostridia bacterium]
MGKAIDWLKSILIIGEEDDEAEGTVDQESETVSKKKTVEEPAPVKRTESGPRVYQGGRSKNAAPVRDEVKIILVKLSNYEQATDVADNVLSKKSVVLNLEDVDISVMRRVLDFLSGVVYAIGGNIKMVANKTYMVAPAGVDLSGDNLWDDLNGEYTV